MIRSEVIKQLIPVISDHLIICNIGLPSQELHLLDDQPSNFYMLGTMGLSSSIGLGLALAQKGKVISIDGDGSVLTNFGTLPTIANNVANNVQIKFVVKVWSGPNQDNLSSAVPFTLTVTNAIIYTDYIYDDTTFTNDNEYIIQNSLVLKMNNLH